MLIGCCSTTPEKVSAARRAGADFIEVGLTGLMALGDGDFEAWRRLVTAEGPPVLASNGFMPPELKVVGPDVDEASLREYVTKAGERLASVGAKVAVFGSSGSRQVPAGWERERAEEQLAAFLQRTAEAFAAHGIAVAVEPLCVAESNLVNTVGEGLRLIRAGAPAARVLADLYHMLQANESLDVLADAGDLLVHAHVASAERRGPTAADLETQTFVERLRDVGYQGGVSLECGWDDFENEIEPALRLLRGWAA